MNTQSKELYFLIFKVVGLIKLSNKNYWFPFSILHLTKISTFSSPFSNFWVGPTSNCHSQSHHHHHLIPSIHINISSPLSFLVNFPHPPFQSNGFPNYLPPRCSCSCCLAPLSLRSSPCRLGTRTRHAFPPILFFVFLIESLIYIGLFEEKKMVLTFK